MSASTVYDEFDQIFGRLPTTDQLLLEEDKTLYFLKAVDMNDRRELGALLDDEIQANGLVADWVAFNVEYECIMAVFTLSLWTVLVLGYLCK